VFSPEVGWSTLIRAGDLDARQQVDVVLQSSKPAPTAINPAAAVAAHFFHNDFMATPPKDVCAFGSFLPRWTRSLTDGYKRFGRFSGGQLGGDWPTKNGCDS
jgi:hypothetical protein